MDPSGACWLSDYYNQSVAPALASLWQAVLAAQGEAEGWVEGNVLDQLGALGQAIGSYWGLSGLVQDLKSAEYGSYLVGTGVLGLSFAVGLPGLALTATTLVANHVP